MSTTSLSLERRRAAWQAHEPAAGLDANAAQQGARAGGEQAGAVPGRTLMLSWLRAPGFRFEEPALDSEHNLVLASGEAVPVRWVRDSRVHQILEGTNEIMRVIIARRLLEQGGMLDQLL